MQYGFLVGFLLGDGGCYHRKCVDRLKREVVITQKNKCDILEDILGLANIRYSKFRSSVSV